MEPRPPARSRQLFVPKTERIEEDEVLTLRVHLSGFSVKHIDCRIIAPSRYVRVCSDPALKNWHFNTLFEDIPEKFNLFEAKTKFDDGIFTITVPKVIPAQTTTGPKALEATTRPQEAPSHQEIHTSKLGPQKSEEITEDKDVEGLKSKSEQMSQKGQDQIPLEANLPLAFPRKQQIDDESTVGEVGDQKGMEEDKEKSAESTDQEKEGEAKGMEKSAESVDQEKEGEAKDMEDASSSSKSAKDTVTTVVTERRYIVDKCTILSLILAIGAYVFYTFYGQSRKKKNK